MNNLAIVGGSGIYKLDNLKLINEFVIDTPFGDMSAPICEMELEGKKFFFLARHGVGHTLNPSQVNYRANIFGLKKIGVDTIVSISAVGSLKDEHSPEDFVVVNQFIDWTKGQRKRTFFEDGIVGHVSVANPVEESLRLRIVHALEKTDINFSTHGTYICIEGPQFSSKAESEIYRSFGADVIGMTNVPEVYLAKEAGIAYGTVAMVTDYDCWKEEHCSVDEIMKVMKNNYKSAKVLVENLIPNLIDNPISFEAENKYAVITDPSKLSKRSDAIIKTLLGK